MEYHKKYLIVGVSPKAHEYTQISLHTYIYPLGIILSMPIIAFVGSVMPCFVSNVQIICPVIPR